MTFISDIHISTFKSVLIYIRIAKPFVFPLQIFATITNKITFSQNCSENRRIRAILAAPVAANSGKKTCAFSYCSRAVVVAVDIVEDDAEDGAKNAAEDDAEDDDDDDVDDDDVDDDGDDDGDGDGDGDGNYVHAHHPYS